MVGSGGDDVKDLNDLKNVNDGKDYDDNGGGDGCRGWMGNTW